MQRTESERNRTVMGIKLKLMDMQIYHEPSVCTLLKVLDTYVRDGKPYDDLIPLSLQDGQLRRVVIKLWNNRRKTDQVLLHLVKNDHNLQIYG